MFYYLLIVYKKPKSLVGLGVCFYNDILILYHVKLLLK